MPQLYFKVSSDWENVVKLREEIEKLQAQLKTTDGNKAPQAVAALNTQINQAQQQLKSMTSEAAKAAVVVGDDLKSNIFKGSQAVNDFTQKIIAQKAVVKDIEADVRRLTDAYRSVRTNPLKASSALTELNGAKRALNEEKAALFGLTQEQSKARLSVKQLKDEYALYNTQLVQSTSSSLSLGKALGIFGGVAALKQLGSEIINVRGQFRSMEVSLETMVGKERAKSLLSSVKQYAAISPLELKDVQSATEMMVGFNIEAEKVPRFVQAIGDISRGESGKFQSLSLAFSQMSAAGKLMGQDLNQMINAGFNPLQIMSEKTGKSMAQLKDDMSKGAISAEKVQQAFIDATSAGGQFYGMAEKESQEVTGRVAILSDAISNKLNEIGESNEGLIKSGIEATTFLVDNYETIGRAVAGLVAVYGTYRAALILNAALELGSTKAVWEKITATKAATAAQAVYNKVLTMNPYVAIGAAVVSLGIAMWALADHTTTAEKAQKRYNDITSASKRQVDELGASIDRLMSIVRSETSTQYDKLKAYKELQKIMPAIFANMDMEKLKTMDQISVDKQAALSKNLLAKVKAKTDAVLAKNKYDQTKSDYDRMRSMGMADQSTLNDAKKEVDVAYEVWKKLEGTVQDIEKLQAEASKPKVKKAEIENKSYWEGKKKEAEAARDALDKSKVGSAEWNKYTKQIQNAEKNLKPWTDPGKEENQAEKLHKKQKEALEKNNEDLLALRRKNQQQEAGLMEESTEKKLALIKADYDAQAQEIEKREKELAKRNKEASVKGLNAKGLTKDQQDEIDKANKLNTDNRKKQESEAYKLELQSMRDYLKEYGTFQQQKLAIAEEYNEKIAKATDEWQKKSLTAERDAKLTGVEINAIKQSVDWGSVFGDFGTIFKDQLQPTIDKLRAISNTNEFRSSPLQDQQILYDLIQKLEQSNATWDSDIFKRVSDDLTVYQAAMRDNIDALERQTVAEKDLASARENLKRVEAAGGDTTQAKIDVQQAQTAFNDASEDVLKFGSKVKEATADLESSSANAVNMFHELEDGLRGLTSGSLKGVGDGLMQLDKLFNGGDITKKAGNALASGFQSLLGKDSKASKAITEALGSTGMAGEIISAILGILDVIGKVGISGIITGLQDTVFNSVEKMIDDVLSGDIIVQPVKNAFKHVGNILDTLTFGGFKSWTNNSNAKEVAETTNRLTSSNEILKQSIDALKDEMEKARGADTVKVYDEAVKKQRELIENTGSILAAQMGYHSSHHSNSYYIDKSMSREDWQRVSEKAGKQVTSTGELWSLSPEELKKVSTLTDVWDKIYNGGKYNKSEYLDQYLKLADTLEQLETQLQKTLTQTTFDEVYDNFVNTLMDMSKSAEDFANDLSKVFMKAMLSNMIGQEYAKKLETWYKKFADNMKDGTLDDKEREALKNEYMGYVDAAIKERDELAKTIGYTSDSSSSQSATSKGFQTMSQDTGSELNGRFTALQIAGEAIRVQATEQTASLRAVSGKMGEVLVLNADIRNIADDTRNILASTFLETVQIRENTGLAAKSLKRIEGKLDNIEKNTKDM